MAKRQLQKFDLWQILSNYLWIIIIPECQYRPRTTPPVHYTSFGNRWGNTFDQDLLILSGFPAKKQTSLALHKALRVLFSIVTLYTLQFLPVGDNYPDLIHWLMLPGKLTPKLSQGGQKLCTHKVFITSKTEAKKPYSFYLFCDMELSSHDLQSYAQCNKFHHLSLCNPTCFWKLCPSLTIIDMHRTDIEKKGRIRIRDKQCIS